MPSPFSIALVYPMSETMSFTKGAGVLTMNLMKLTYPQAALMILAIGCDEIRKRYRRSKWWLRRQVLLAKNPNVLVCALVPDHAEPTAAALQSRLERVAAWPPSVELHRQPLDRGAVLYWLRVPLRELSHEREALLALLDQVGTSYGFAIYDTQPPQSVAEFANHLCGARWHFTNREFRYVFVA